MPAPLLYDVPFPEYEGDEDKVLALYLKYWKQVEKEVTRLSRLDPSLSNTELLQYQQVMLERIEMLMNNMGKEMSVAVAPILYDAILTGVAYSAVVSGNVVATNINNQTFDRLLKQTKKRFAYDYQPSRNYRVQKTITDTQADLLKATQNTKEGVKRLVRSTVGEVLASNAPRPQKKENLEQKVKEALKTNQLREGLKDSDIAIVDRIGRRWKLDTYVQMVVRTKTSTAYFDGIREQAREEGMDLAVINTHPDTKDACLNFQGMVISLNGTTPGYPTYAELKASKLIFHPNCRHFARPIPSMDMLPSELRNTHKKLLTAYRKKFNK